MTRDLYKGLQCSKSREEVEQSYSEDNYISDESPSDKFDRLLDTMSEVSVNYESTDDTFIEVNPHLKTSYKSKDYTVKWGDIDITDGWANEFSPITVSGKALDELAKIPVREDKPKINMCQYNDRGWCYYKGDKKSNDDNGQCNKAESCEVNDE